MNPLPTANAVSAGGVVFRQQDHQVDIALILVGPKLRWQLPKGTLNPHELAEQAALREVREETGLEAELLDLLERIEYWFYASRGGHRVRFHKFVHFYLMRFISGNVNDHDQEVEEARWFEIHEAIDMLAYESEKKMVRKARELILAIENADAKKGAGESHRQSSTNV
jgi:8-oxo-dGTP diphosphatase